MEALVNNWTTTFLQDKLKITNEDALYALSFSVLGLTVARLIAGIFVKKIIFFCGYDGFLTVNHCGQSFINEQPVLIILLLQQLIITGLGLAAGFPVILGYVGQLYANLSGTAFSIALVIALDGKYYSELFFWMDCP